MTDAMTPAQRRGTRPPSVLVENRGLRPRRGAASEPPIDNGNTDSAPDTVGPTQGGGDPHGVEIVSEGTPRSRQTRIMASRWAGYPDEWETPLLSHPHLGALTDTAWSCLDLNSSVLSTMPPYLTGAEPTNPVEWIENPNPDLYSSWEEFAKTLCWDYQLGEAFVLATAWYDDGLPARFHIPEPWMVNVEMDGPFRRYTIGGADVTSDILHIRYKSSTGDAHGHGPLEIGNARLVAASVLHRYAMNFARGNVPSWLESEEELEATQATALQEQWLDARAAGFGLPAVLWGGVTFKTSAVSPKEASLFDLSQMTDSRIAVLLGVPPFLQGLPSGGDSLTYSTVVSLFDFHWRAYLRPKASAVMAALSGWLLPRGSRIEVNRDSYVQPDPLTRAQMYEILIRAGVMTPEQAQAAERLLDAAPAELATGVMR